MDLLAGRNCSDQYFLIGQNLKGIHKKCDFVVTPEKPLDPHQHHYKVAEKKEQRYG